MNYILQNRSRINRTRTVIVGLFTAVLTLLPMSNSYACPSQPFIGGMCAFGGNFSIRGWAEANGQILPISQYTAVFSLLGTTFGGDGRTTFGLPDLRGRAASGVGTGAGLSTNRWGQKKGTEFVSVSVSQMPSHNHTAATTVTMAVTPADAVVTSSVEAMNTVGNSTLGGGNIFAVNNGSSVYSSAAPNVSMSASAVTSSANASVVTSGTTTIGNQGGNTAVENRMPFVAVTWLIALQGQFPSRS